MKQLYLAQNDSPYTTLGNDINNTQTTITVANGSLLPSPPNLLTIGYDLGTTEIVLMTAKSGNTLTVVRGYESQSKSWSIATKIARVFTSADYNAIVENIEGLQGDSEWDGVINKDMVPSIPNKYSLGTFENPLKEIYAEEIFVSNNSLYVDGAKVLSSTGNTVEVSTTVDQHLTVNTSGLGTTRVGSEKETMLYSGDVINLQALGEITALSESKITFKTTTNGDNIAFETQGVLSDINFKSKRQINFDCNDTNFTTMPKVNGVPINAGNSGGLSGVGLQYNWNDSLLGIKREDEINYTYVDLKGQTGAQGIAGTNGIDGRDIQIQNNGTHIQMRYIGDTAWISLIALESLKGQNGDKGDSGSQGIQGEKGEQGIQGERGIQGLKGDTGIQGIQGLKGDTGEQGVQGIQGLKGDTGEQGIQGIQGIQGLKGDTGDGGTIADDSITDAKLSSIGVKKAMADITTQTTINAVSNIYTLNMLNSKIKKFKITTADGNAKTVAITNLSADAEITIKVVFTNNAMISFPTGVSWKDGISPTFTVGKIHFVYLITDDGGTSYQGTWTGAW